MSANHFSIIRSFIFCTLALSFMDSSTSAATVVVQVGPNGSLQFAPNPVTIQVGDTVQWKWASSDHSATSRTAGDVFDSGVHNSGFSFSHTFNTAGDVPYVCTVHEGLGMTGTVKVAAASTPTPTATPTPTSTPSAIPTASPTPTPSATPASTPLTPLITKGFVRVELQTVASGLTAPVDLVQPNDGSGRIFVVEQVGRISILKDGQLSAGTFLNLSSRLVTLNPKYDERGLLGVAFHPGFADPSSPGFRKLYTYTNEPVVAGTADFTVPMSGEFNNQAVIAEWQVSANNPDVVDVTTRRELMRIDHPQFNHDGGQLAFRPGEPYLYISEGDGGAANDVGDGHNPATGNGQDTTTALGKILRIDPLDPALTSTSGDPMSANSNYRIPASNPFVSSPPTTGSVREIFAYGFRNPFRFSFDAESGKFIVADVGQDHIEEVDVVEAGKNYGWHHKEGTFLFDPATGNVTPDSAADQSLTHPIAEYDHKNGIAILGGYIYRGTAIPALAGKYVFGDLSTAFNTPNGHLFYLDDLSSGIIHQLRIGHDDRSLGLFVKAFGRDSAGEIYLLADSNAGPSGNGGRVMKLVQSPASVSLLNLSTRMDVQIGDDALIGGFIVIGGAPKAVVLRGIGPSLVSGGITNPLADPVLELHDGTGKLIDSNDNWETDPRKQEVVSRNLAPKDSHESALFETLDPGSYTAVVKGVNGGTGIGLVELYDVDQSAPANAVNISTRGVVEHGDNVMIGGLIIGGSAPQRVLLRAIGPSLANAGVANSLQDPMLGLYDTNGAQIASNDDWKQGQQAEIEATGIPPTNDKESAILTTLAPGSYTAIVRGVNDTSGVALVEAYELAL